MDSGETPKTKTGPTATALAELEIQVAEMKLRESLTGILSALGDIGRGRRILNRLGKDSPRRQAAIDAEELQRQADFVNPVSPGESSPDGPGTDEADPGHQVRVLKAVGDYFGRKRKRK